MSCPSCYSSDTICISKNPYKMVSIFAGVCFIGASLTLNFSDMIWGIGIGLVVIAIGKYYQTSFKKCNNCGRKFNESSGF